MTNTPTVPASEIAQYIEALSPPLGDEEGFLFGDSGIQVRGVLVCWMAELAALERAAAEGCNLVVCHEDLFFPYRFLDPAFERHITWPVNRRRIRRLAEHGITVYRSHSTLDRAHIVDAFSDALGLGEPVARQWIYRVHKIPQTPVRDLALTVKTRMGLPAVRVSGNLEARVSRVGLAVGGTGLNVNVSFMQGLIDLGSDCLIAGEASETGIRFADDSGVPLIETGHAASENPGIGRLCAGLRARFPGLKVIFHECDRPWVVA